MKYLREFFSFPDIVVMSLIGFAALGVTLFQTSHDPSHPHLWLNIGGGAVLFMVSEYTNHRFLFHMAPPKNPYLRQLMHRLHYDHHERPNELHLLFLPLWYTLPQLAVLGTVAALALGGVVHGIAFVSGSSLMLLIYEWRHYVAHRPIAPLTPWGRWMKKYHLWHHFKNEHYWFGVTNPALDVLLGTYRDVTGVDKSPTAKRLDADH